MKEITIQIDERIYDSLKAKKNFRDQLDGCVRDPSDSDKVLFAIVNKIEEGKNLLQLCVKGEPLL